jgi:hypothetical protein
MRGYDNPTLFQHARDFLAMMQKDSSSRAQRIGNKTSANRPFDGGFYYSPVSIAANKGGIEEDESGFDAYFRSYATATCDGLLALLACDETADAQAVKSALQWLLDHPHVPQPEGIDPEDPTRWEEAMIYYHLMVRAEAYRALGVKSDWQAIMVSFLKGQQGQDGSFVNPKGAINKENDPYLASAMAIYVLL